MKYGKIERTKFRFPVFSDDEGVKLQTKQQHPPFSKDYNWIMTEEAQQPLNPEIRRDERALRRSARRNTDSFERSFDRREELKRHRENLPDYSKKFQPEVTPTGKKRLFGNQSAQNNFRKYEHVEHAEHVEPVVAEEEVPEQTEFVPTFVPESIIADEPAPVEEVSNPELLSAMTKKEYLLFDTEPAAYQVKKDSDPTVRKFNHPFEE